MRRVNLALLGLGVLAICAAFVANSLAIAADEPEEALKEEVLKLNKASSETAQRAKLLAFVKDNEKAKKGVALAYKLQKDAKDDDKPFNFNGALLVGRAAHFVKMNREAEYFYTFCVEYATKLESGEKLLQSFDGLIDLYWDTKRFDDMIAACERFLEIKGLEEVDRAKPFVLERLVQAKAKQGKIEEALRITEGLIQLDEGGFYFVQLKGWVQREGGKFDDSIETYRDALDKLDATKRLMPEQKEKMKDNVHYILSGLYVDIKKIDKAAEQLQLLIKKHPDNPTYKNDLGFIWADNDMNLEESEKLIKEAIDLDKKEKEKLKKEGKIDEVTPNAAYLDSFGWVLFKQKKYKEALEPLKKASADEVEGSHLEIWDHLGDCYLALGQKKEAIGAWKKGLTMDDISQRDAARRKKVTLKLSAAGTKPS